jgi:DinB superfamily
MSTRERMLNESTRLRLEKQLDCLPVLLAGMAPETLEYRPHPEQWTAREYLAHLARYQVVFVGRLQRILSEPRPILLRHGAEEDPEWSSWIHRTTADLLPDLERQREALIRQVAGLTDRDLERTGVHERLGEMTVGQ